MFRVQSDGSVQLDMNRPGSPQTFDWQNAPAQEAQSGDWLAAPPPRPGEQPMATIVNQSGQMPMAQLVPMGSVVGGDNDYSAGDYGYGRKKNKFLVILIFLVLLLIGAGGFGYWLVMQNTKKGMEAKKQQYNESLQKRHWDDVIAIGTNIKETSKDPADTKEVELGIAWSQVQLQLNPTQLTSKEKIRNGISELLTFFRTHRSNANFSSFRKDFTEAAFHMVNTGAAFLETNPDSSLYDALQPLLETAKEAGSELSDKDLVKQWADEAQAKYVTARTAIDASLAKTNWIGRLQDVLTKENLGQIDTVQSEYQDLVKKHPLLQTDSDLTSKLDNLKQVEPGWVKYTASNSAPVANKPTFGPSIRICPPVKTPEGVQDDKNVVLAMTRGTLYGLSARTGKDRWALRVGQDVRELPPRVSLGGEAPDLAFVVTTEDAGQSYLSQMNLLTGERNWTRKLPGPCPGGPLLISNNRLVVPLKETIAIVEAGTGKMSGYYTISGYDISSQPAHDKMRDRLFVPVDRGRIFVIDLTGRKCVSVIYTGHGSGQMKGAPLIVDNLMIACIATGSGSGSTRIRAYDISAKGESPTFEPPIGIYDMPGHASTTPYVDGNETLGIVSDQGLLWLFGIGKSSSVATSQSKGATPFYPLTRDPMKLKLQINSELKKDQPRPRVQVAHVSLNDWWVFSHEHLIRNVYDPFRSVLLPSPVGSLPLGTPLHRAEITPDGKLIVLVTQTKGQAQMLASGIDLTTGAVVWQTQLGTEASQEPVAMADSVAMLDRAGAVFTLKSSDIPTLNNWQEVGNWPALPLTAASHSLLKTLTGQTLVSMSYDPVRARIILRKIDLNGIGSTIKKEFPHTFAPMGTSIVLDDGSALIPCRDGNIYRFNFTDGTSQSLFSWRDPVALTNVFGHLLMPSTNQFFATNGLNKVLRWDRSPQGIWKKNANDFELPARIVTNLSAISGNRIVVGDEAGNLHGLSLASLGTSKQWNLKGTITKGPFPMGVEGVGCIVDGKKLWWVNSVEDDEGRFFTDPAIVSIIGDGVTIGDDILLAVLRTDPSTGMLANYLWIERASGKLVQSEKLPEGLAPSSGPTALGKNWAFAPLSDGTVRILVKPAATTAANPQ
ncbi:MAG TPA: PQQ-binding-like beta-propeller repeat protein [Gemmatales bacterium]|nr:PQQ-binding-like beta-propeller repeat protein [Gemmatales bacterium]